MKVIIWEFIPQQVFGKVVSGMDVVSKVERLGSRSGQTSKKVVIEDCGEVKE